MTSVRRRVLRPPAPVTAPQFDTRAIRWRGQLAKEQQSHRRWFSKLKRAMHALERAEQPIARLEKALADSRLPR
jgi:hypothetical protein